VKIKSTLKNQAGEVLELEYQDIDSVRELGDRKIFGVHAYCFYENKLVVVYAENKNYRFITFCICFTPNGFFKQSHLCGSIPQPAVSLVYIINKVQQAAGMACIKFIYLGRPAVRAQITNCIMRMNIFILLMSKDFRRE